MDEDTDSRRHGLLNGDREAQGLRDSSHATHCSWRQSLVTVNKLDGFWVTCAEAAAEEASALCVSNTQEACQKQNCVRAQSSRGSVRWLGPTAIVSRPTVLAVVLAGVPQQLLAPGAQRLGAVVLPIPLLQAALQLLNCIRLAGPGRRQACAPDVTSQGTSHLLDRLCWRG